MKSPSHPPPAASFARALQLPGLLGLVMSACILAGTWAGFKLDAWLDAGGVVTAIGILTGVLAGGVAAGLLLYRSIPWKP